MFIVVGHDLTAPFDSKWVKKITHNLIHIRYNYQKKILIQWAESSSVQSENIYRYSYRYKTRIRVEYIDIYYNNTCNKLL